MWLSCSPKSWQLFMVAGQLNTSSSCKQCLSTQYLLQSMYRKHWWWNATVLAWRDSCCWEAYHYLLMMIMVDLICRFRGTAAEFPLAPTFRRFAWRVLQHMSSTFALQCIVFGCTVSVALRKPLTTFGIETHFKQVISYQKCLQGCPVSVLWHHTTVVNTVRFRLVLWCQFSRVVELLLNRKPCPWDMRNLEIEVWMSVQCCYNQGRRSLSNQGYELMCDFILFVMSIEWMAKDSIMPCIK